MVQWQSILTRDSQLQDLALLTEPVMNATFVHIANILRKTRTIYNCSCPIACLRLCLDASMHPYMSVTRYSQMVSWFCQYSVTLLDITAPRIRTAFNNHANLPKMFCRDWKRKEAQMHRGRRSQSAYRAFSYAGKQLRQSWFKELSARFDQFNQSHVWKGECATRTNDKNGYGWW